MIRQSIRVGIEGSSDVLELDVSELVDEKAGVRVQRLQTGVLHLENAAHLLNEQERIGSHQEARGAMALGPLERRNESTVFGDVVRGDANRFAEFLDERPIGPFDAHAVAGGARISARPSVNVGDDVGGH